MEIKYYTENVKSIKSTYREIDVIVSRDCTLRCSYCYLKKKQDEFYDMEEVLKSVDILLAELSVNDGVEGVILSLYPEPWVNINRTNNLIIGLLNLLLKYPKFITKFMFMLGTNGVLLDKEIPILEEILERASVAITLDGIKEQHDKYRIFPNGAPSWDIVKNNIKKYGKKFHIDNTKVTFGPDTLKYIYDSSIFLWEEMNFIDINMNVVFENLWGDELNECLNIFEEQLDLLTNDIIKNKRWETFQYNSLVGMRFVPSLNFNMGSENSAFHPPCGATIMRSIDSDGGIYPCFRLSPYSLNEDKRFLISNNREKTRTLYILSNIDSLQEKCRLCPLLEKCSACIGNSYEDNKEHSIYWRTTHHCEFIKLQSKYAIKIFNAMNPENEFEKIAEKEVIDAIKTYCPRII